MATTYAWPHEQLNDAGFRACLSERMQILVDGFPEECAWTSSELRDMWAVDHRGRVTVIALVDGEWTRVFASM